MCKSRHSRNSESNERHTLDKLEDLEKQVVIAGAVVNKCPKNAQYRISEPFIGPFDPCPPIRVKVFNTPPNLYLGFQPAQLPQFSLSDALKLGTLWPCLYSPYPYEPTP